MDGERRKDVMHQSSLRRRSMRTPCPPDREVLQDPRMVFNSVSLPSSTPSAVSLNDLCRPRNTLGFEALRRLPTLRTRMIKSFNRRTTVNMGSRIGIIGEGYRMTSVPFDCDVGGRG